MKRNYEPVIDIIFAIVLGLMAIGCFILQTIMLNSQTTQKETILFNILQFLLTAGFGWFSTRAINRGEFNRNLKKFAYSAYRRVTDINNIVTRLKSYLNSMLFKRDESEGYNELNVILAIVDDTKQIIKSSIADWADVIGDELQTLEKINNLERERDKIDLDSIEASIKTRYTELSKELDKEIKKLRLELPTNLRIYSESSFDFSIFKDRAVNWLADQHKVEGGLIIKVVSGSHYGDYEIPLKLKPKEELQSKINSKDAGLDVVGKNGIVVGRILNKSPFKYKDFRIIIEKCYGTLELSLEFIEIKNTEKHKDDNLVWYTVRVKNLPLSFGER